MNSWQEDRDKTKEFFLKKQEEGLAPGASPWVTLAVGRELQQLSIDGFIKEGMSALDVGCGIGVEALYLAKQGLKVTGIDFMPKSIALANDLAKLVEVQAEFICDDFIAMDLKGRAGGFDVVIDQGCFHHIPVKERIEYVTRVHGLLADGGIFFLRGFSDEMLPSPTNDGPIRLTSDDIIQAFQTGFSVEKLYRFKNIPLPYSNKPQIFWAFLGRKK